MLCIMMAQQEMQQLKQQVRTLRLALAMKQHGKQGLQQQQQHYQQSNNKGRRARTDKDGRWHRLPRPKVTIRMKVAAILAEKAAEVERAAEPNAKAQMQTEVSAAATQGPEVTEVAATNEANASAADAVDS